MSVNYSDLYSFIRAAAGDFGDYDSDGTLVANSNLFANLMIDNTITLLLLEDATYSKVSGSDAVTPDFTTDTAKALFCYQCALSLVVSDTLKEHRNREASFRRDRTELLANIIGKINELGGSTYGIPYAQDGAAEAMYDMPDRITDFVAANA